MKKRARKNKATTSTRKAKTPKPKTTPAPQARALHRAAAVGLSTRAAVYGCIRRVTGDPNLTITPEMGIGALRVRRADLGVCLNQQLGLRGDDLYRGDEIGGDWIVQDVINDADGRRD